MKKLKSVTFPSSLTSIGDRAFFNSGLKEVVVPNSVASIGDYAFARNALLTVLGQSIHKAFSA